MKNDRKKSKWWDNFRREEYALPILALGLFGVVAIIRIVTEIMNTINNLVNVVFFESSWTVKIVGYLVTLFFVYVVHVFYVGKKNNLLVLSIIIFGSLSMMPGSASAISGACSYHNGVNCSIGANYLGNAVCNDGWVSQTSYYETSECGYPKVANKCMYPASSGCMSDSDYEQKQRMINGLNTVSGWLPISESQTASLAECRTQIDSYNKATQDYNQCIVSEHSYNPGTGLTEFAPPIQAQSTQPDPTSAVFNEKVQQFLLEAADQQKKSEVLRGKHQACQDSFGLSDYNSEKNSCECIETTTFIDGRCVPDSEIVDAPQPDLSYETFLKQQTENGLLDKQKPVDIPKTQSFWDMPSRERIKPFVYSDKPAIPPSTAISTMIKPDSHKEPSRKHWYEWLNPFSWFK